MDKPEPEVETEGTMPEEDPEATDELD